MYSAAYTVYQAACGLWRLWRASFHVWVCPAALHSSFQALQETGEDKQLPCGVAAFNCVQDAEKFAPSQDAGLAACIPGAFTALTARRPRSLECFVSTHCQCRLTRLTFLISYLALRWYFYCSGLSKVECRAEFVLSDRGGSQGEVCDEVCLDFCIRETAQKAEYVVSPPS